VSVEVALIRWAETMRGQPFVWGETDCWALVLRAIAVLGRPVRVVPWWRSEPEARRALTAVNWRDTLADAGFAAIESTPRIGDVLVVERDWPCAHICLGRAALSSGPVNGVGLTWTRALAGASVWRP
jgi:cell wall-associated NlpC family hydrolase